MFLEKMAALQREEVQKRRARFRPGEIEARAAQAPRPRDFLGALRRASPPALIAEIKRASPSAGVIREEADLPGMAAQYEGAGASAVSVLTESRYFHGALEHLKKVKEKISLPILQKDFLIHPFQIYEGRSMGADAVLLIAALLTREELADFALRVRRLGMMPLVEVHGEEDLERTAGLDLPLIGINNRDLKTMAVDLETTRRLIGKIPAGTLVVSESGIRTREEVHRLMQAGAEGILVGEALMRAADPAAKIRELLTVKG